MRDEIYDWDGRIRRYRRILAGLLILFNLPRLYCRRKERLSNYLLMMDIMRKQPALGGNICRKAARYIQILEKLALKFRKNPFLSSCKLVFV